jgi:hypothetical protein
MLLRAMHEENQYGLHRAVAIGLCQLVLNLNILLTFHNVGFDRLCLL